MTCHSTEEKNIKRIVPSACGNIPAMHGSTICSEDPPLGWASPLTPSVCSVQGLQDDLKWPAWAFPRSTAAQRETITEVSKVRLCSVAFKEASNHCSRTDAASMHHLARNEHRTAKLISSIAWQTTRKLPDVLLWATHEALHAQGCSVCCIADGHMLSSCQ